MANLMTASEVISSAFDRSVESTKIPSQLITAAQDKHVRPILGDDFYDAVVADTVTYATLITQIKPMLAQYVKYWALPKIFVETGSVGMARIQGQNRQSANKDEMEVLRQDALYVARMHGEILRKYLDDNQSSYPLYFKGSNPQEQVKIRGGIVMDKGVKDDTFYTDDDDYTIYLKNY